MKKNLFKKIPKIKTFKKCFQISFQKYSTAKKTAPPFHFQKLFEHEYPVETEYYRLDEASKYVSEIVGPDNESFLKVGPEALQILSSTANRDVAHLLRSSHLQQIRNILDDKEASENDKFVALTLLKNANIASSFILPSCQDTG